MQTPDDKLIAKIKALLETRGCTEAEAQSRTAKAQELLEKYNLDMAILNSGTTANGKRQDTKRKGGLYSWQRRLWDSVAKLNFCHYLSLKGLERGSSYEHRIIGSHANVISTEMMAQYLQDTVERLAQQWAKDEGYRSVFVREAIAYREGMVARLSVKLNARREDIVSEERRKEEERKQEQARTNAAPGGTALTILDVISSEADFNNDYLNGWELGTTAQNRKEQEAYAAAYREKAAKQRAEQEEYDRLHPEEAAARLKAAREEMDRWTKKWEKRQARRNQTPPRPRAQTAEEKRAGLGSYWRGYDDAANVGIDQQAEHDKKKAIR